MRRSLVTTALVVLSACGSSPVVDADWFAAQATADDPVKLADFPGAAILLSGFDEPTASSWFAKGDRALYGIELDEHGEIERWLMLFEVVDESVRDDDGQPLISMNTFTITSQDQTERQEIVISRLSRVRVSRFLADGTPLGTSEVAVPRDGLCRGVAGACAAFGGYEGPARSIDDATVKTFSEAMASMLAIFAIVQEDELLSSLLWRVVERPSAWSVITSFGVRVNLDIGLDKSQPVEVTSPHGRQVYRSPLTVTANDAPALLVSAVVTEPTSPLNVGGGTLALCGFRPGDPDVTFGMRLLAARRAPD